MVLDIDVATLLQNQLGLSLGLGANATIFEICAALETQPLNTTAVITGLNSTLTALVPPQLDTIAPQISAALIDILLGAGVPPDQVIGLLTSILTQIFSPIGTGFTLVVNQILADVRASLDLFVDCNTSTIPTNGAGSGTGGAGIVGGLQLPSIQQMIPTVQHSSQPLPSGDPMLQLQSTISSMS